MARQFVVSSAAYVSVTQALQLPAAVREAPVKRVAEPTTWLPQVVMATANPAAFIKKLASGRQQTAWSAATHGSPAQIASEAVAMAYVKRKKIRMEIRNGLE